MYTNIYDDYFKAAASKYLSSWNGVVWCWLKAESIAESNLDPNATAPDGGMGLMQFMPGTWADVCRQMGGWATHDPDGRSTAYNPYSAIMGGAMYLSTLWSQWSAPRPKFDRLQLTQAAYNTGFGNMLKAQRLAHGAADYETIAAQLVNVTGDDAKITLAYVERIHAIYTVLAA